MVNIHYMVDGHPIHNKDPYNGYYKSLWTIGWLAPINGYSIPAFGPSVCMPSVSLSGGPGKAAGKGLQELESWPAFRGWGKQKHLHMSATLI
jgi:hypothetical protein